MDAKRIDEHASRKLAICQLWRDGQLSTKDCERQCGEQDALLAVEAVAEQIAAHVRDFHGPASAVENDTAADVKPYRCHATSERDNEHGSGIERQPGICRRDWLAGLAMQGMAAGPYWCENFTADKPEFLSAVAVAAYAMADALIAEGKK